MIDFIDINERIKTDFGDKASDAVEILKDAVGKTDYLNHPRIIRCIIFLADKNIENLKLHIQTAINDPRDVMFWAEYARCDIEQNPKRVRDFNKTFDQSEKNVIE
jgi:hypothetical protein